MNRRIAMLNDAWNGSSVMSRRVIFAAFIACVMVACLAADELPHLCRGGKGRPWMQRSVYVVPGVKVIVIGEHSETLDEWMATNE